jgi:hypothetical protein
MSCNCKKTNTKYLCTCADASDSPLPPCDGEPCEVLLDSGCVQIDRDLTVFGILKGDRLNTAIEKINLNSMNIMVAQEDTDTIDMEGDGTTSNPLKGNVKISALTGNLVTAEQDGISVVIDSQVVLGILTLIKTDPVLYDYICKEIIKECGVCTQPDLNVDPSTCSSYLQVTEIDSVVHSGWQTSVTVKFKVLGATMDKIKASLNDNTPATIDMNVNVGEESSVAFAIPTGSGDWTIKLQSICKTGEPGPVLLVPVTV